MPAQLGKIYVGPSGVQLIVTKGGPGMLSDGETPLQLKDSAAAFETSTSDGPLLQLGKRFKSPDGAVEVLINKAGNCHLQYDGQGMVPKEAKPLPSSD